MRLMEKMLNQINENKKISTNELYYGYIGQSKAVKEIINGETYYVYPYCLDEDKGFVVMQKLTKRERDRYLKSKYNTFLDSVKSQLFEYITIKNSNIEYYRIPSMQDLIVPCIESTLEDDLVGHCKATLEVCALHYDFDIQDKYVTLGKIREYEQALNRNPRQTFYYNPNNVAWDERRDIEWS